MIQIEDYDLPITVAQKIITGTMPSNASGIEKVWVKVLANDEKAGETVDMFDVNEIKEIADYLMIFYNAHHKVVELT